MVRALVFLVSVLCVSNLSSQEMAWEKLDAAEMTGSCTSTTDCNTGMLCYGLVYTPGTEGVLTSYTTGFLISCTDVGNPILSNESCVMSDNSEEIDGCGNMNPVILAYSSGNSGSIDVEVGVPVYLHQICVSIESGETIDMIEEVVTDLSTSIDPSGGGDPISEFPSYTEMSVVYDDECMSCEDIDVCSIDFGTDGNLLFDFISANKIRTGESMTNSESISQSFDVYDEIAFDCSAPGSADDITFEMTVLNTDDINGNGLINQFAGANHYISQESDGLKGQLLHTQVSGEESSSGDIRGYQIEVTFAEHVNVKAEQLTVLIESANSLGNIFESSALVFKEKDQSPLGTADYLGYYNTENDLTGNCMPTPAMSAWDKSLTGVFVMDDLTTVDLTDPCLPENGTTGSNDDVQVHASNDAGISANTEIGGFIFTVYAENVAAHDELDDGSGTLPDDGIIANAENSSNDIVASKLLGIEIEGCISFAIVLPIKLSFFKAEAIHDDLIRLDWESVREESSDRYEIEWSLDGESFIKIGATQALGSGIDYTFDHLNPSGGINYYRLKMIDQNGYSEYSSIVSVAIENQQSTIVYPNPSESVLHIHSKDIEQVEFINHNGVSVLSKEYQLKDDIELNVEHFQPGYYLIRIKTSTQEFLEKFIKI